MKIGGVTISKNHGGMLIPGREELLYAIKRFIWMHIPDSDQTPKAKKDESYQPSSPMEAAKIAAILHRAKINLDKKNREEFESRLIKGIREALSDDGHFWNSFPNDFGFSPINGTTISVKDLKDDNGNHLLFIQNGWLGHRIEEPLAEALELERELLDLNIEVTVPAKADSFEIDFDELLATLKTLDGLDDIKNISGIDAAKRFANDHYGSLPLMQGKHSLYMRPNHIELGQPWNQDGAILSGPLFTGHWGNQDGLNTPTIDFHITNGINSQWNPFLDRDNRQKAEDLAQRIADKITEAYIV